MKGKTGFADSKKIIWKWMDLWEAGKHCLLVKENEEVSVEMGWGFTYPKEEELES